MVATRTLRLDRFDDGVNAWESARIAPPPALDGLIEAYGDYSEITGSFTTRRELPHAEGVMIVNLGEPIAITGGDGAVLRLRAGEAFAAGAHLRPALSHSAGAQAGIHVLLPLATLRRLLGVPMHELTDRVVPLDALIGRDVRTLGARLCEAADRHARVALLDAALAKRLSSMPPPDRQQMHALAALRRHPDRDLAEIARDIGWSRKHFSARIRDAVGVGPRSFRRLIRFQSLTAAIARETGPPCWAGLAHEAGYCDQSHLIREFREFAGMTPGDYVARSLPASGGVIEP